jgi:LysM repeat protein
MSLEEKYKSVVELGKALEVIGGSVVEANGKLKIGGKTKTQFDKDQLWDEIKKVGGESPSDVEAYINVEQTEFYTIHTVKSGESLSLFAKRYYKDPMK